MTAGEHDNALGNFLKDRRNKIDPASLGYPMGRRRTPGLRREEVAQRANVSPAWYTWLEQGRGGTPSADVLDRLARGMGLTEAEREHLFLLAHNRPPEVPASRPSPAVTPALQRLLDSLGTSPATIRNAAWDVLAANRAARVISVGPGAPGSGYNILESLFHQLETGAWDSLPSLIEGARLIVAHFRAEAFRGGYGPRVREVVEGLLQTSPLFRAAWNGQEVAFKDGAANRFSPPGHTMTFEPSTFAVDGSPGLTLAVMTPASEADREAMSRLLEESPVL